MKKIHGREKQLLRSLLILDVESGAFQYIGVSPGLERTTMRRIGSGLLSDTRRVSAALNSRYLGKGKIHR
jgi:hypothetical protein